MALSLSGNLSDKPFSDIVAVLKLQRATGTLTCGSGEKEKSVYVSGGKIIFATSRDTYDRLGEVMVRSGKLTRSQLERSLTLHQKSAGLKKIGAIFVESGFVAPKDLFGGLKQQVRGIIHSLILLAEGPYRFEEQMPADVIPLQIDIDELLHEVAAKTKKK